MWLVGMMFGHSLERESHIIGDPVAGLRPWPPHRARRRNARSPKERHDLRMTGGFHELLAPVGANVEREMFIRRRQPVRLLVRSRSERTIGVLFCETGRLGGRASDDARISGLTSRVILVDP
jgi:hypothetical protein